MSTEITLDDRYGIIDLRFTQTERVDNILINGMDIVIHCDKHNELQGATLYNGSLDADTIKNIKALGITIQIHNDVYES